MAGTTASIAGDWERLNNCMHRLTRFNFQRMHKEMGEAMVSSTRRRFREEEDPEGRPWKKSLRAELNGGKTLSDSGKLKNSINYHATTDGVEIGTNDKRASTHQGDNGSDTVIRAKTSRGLRFKLSNGSWATKQSVTIPRREFLGVSRDDEQELGDILNEHIEECAR